jgi:hypothetical protein
MHACKVCSVLCCLPADGEEWVEQGSCGSCGTPAGGAALGTAEGRGRLHQPLRKCRCRVLGGKGQGVFLARGGKATVYSSVVLARPQRAFTRGSSAKPVQGGTPPWTFSMRMCQTWGAHLKTALTIPQTVTCNMVLAHPLSSTPPPRPLSLLLALQMLRLVASHLRPDQVSAVLRCHTHNPVLTVPLVAPLLPPPALQTLRPDQVSAVLRCHTHKSVLTFPLLPPSFVPFPTDAAPGCQPAEHPPPPNMHTHLPQHATWSTDPPAFCAPPPLSLPPLPPPADAAPGCQPAEP